MIKFIQQLIKQFLCQHPDIIVETNATTEYSLLIIKSIIQCTQCKKTFTQHPHANCCHVMHIHSQIMLERFTKDYKGITQGFSQCQTQPQPQTQ